MEKTVGKNGWKKRLEKSEVMTPDKVSGACELNALAEILTQCPLHGSRTLPMAAGEIKKAHDIACFAYIFGSLARFLIHRMGKPVTLARQWVPAQKKFKSLKFIEKGLNALLQRTMTVGCNPPLAL